MDELTIAEREAEGGVTVLSLTGALEKATAPALEKRISGLPERSRLRLVVDCDRLSRITSEGMGSILSHLIRIRKDGGDIKFCRMRGELRSVLSQVGLGKLVTVRDSESDALSDFRKADAASASKAAPSEPEKLRISVEERGPVAVLALHGSVDRNTLETLDKAIRGLFERGLRRIVVDCAELSYISSNGMGVFISYVSKARNLGGDVRFCSLREIAKTVVNMLGLHRLFEVHETRDAAIASFK